VTEGQAIDVEPAPDGSDDDTSSDRLRVALVLGPSTEGIGRHVASLAAGLTTRGMRVDVYGPAATESQFDFAAAGARVTAIDIPATPGPRDVGVVSQLRRALRADPVQLIHAHGLRAGFIAGIARPGDTPLVVSWHQTFASHPLARLANRSVARTVANAAELSLCASPELFTTATRLGAKDARLCLVPAPVLPPPSRDRTQVREEFGLAPETPLLLSVGRLHGHERHDVLIAAAAKWRHLVPTPTVIIEGTGPAYRDLAAQIITSRAPVILVGHRADLSDLLNAADLAVITSDGESRQGFAQEALASGIPLVVSDQGGLPGIVGEAALLVPPDDVDALVAAVRSLLEDPDLRATYAEAGLGRAATWPTDADTLEQVSTAYVEITRGIPVS
jgi:glycosyltransferase involved in cell wall biosynthesis